MSTQNRKDSWQEDEKEIIIFLDKFSQEVTTKNQASNAQKLIQEILKNTKNNPELTKKLSTLVLENNISVGQEEEIIETLWKSIQTELSDKNSTTEEVQNNIESDKVKKDSKLSQDEARMTQDPNQPSNNMSCIAVLIFLIAVFGSISFLIYRVVKSTNPLRTASECQQFYTEIIQAHTPQYSNQRGNIISKATEWRKDGKTLNEQCPNTVDLNLDNNFDKLLEQNAGNFRDAKLYGKAVESYCGIRREYKFSDKTSPTSNSDFDQVQKNINNWLDGLDNTVKDRVKKLFNEQKNCPVKK